MLLLWALHSKNKQTNKKNMYSFSVFMCIHVHTCEDPHCPVHSIDVSTDQHLHQQSEQLWPGLGPVPVGDGRHGVRNTGADFADRLPQTAWQQLPDGGFSLEGDDRSLTTFGSKSPLRSNKNCVQEYFRKKNLWQKPTKEVFLRWSVVYLICSFRRPEFLWLGAPVSFHILLQDDWC